MDVEYVIDRLNIDQDDLNRLQEEVDRLTSRNVLLEEYKTRAEPLLRLMHEQTRDQQVILEQADQMILVSRRWSARWKKLARYYLHLLGLEGEP